MLILADRFFSAPTTKETSWSTFAICATHCPSCAQKRATDFGMYLHPNAVNFRYDSALSRCAENDVMKVFCVVTCLWIIGWPLKLMLGYDDDTSLTAYYRRRPFCT